ncbi:MAG TPA: leucyl/phenylalanyl-tRNA--protein transferase [Syntrophales bacterium]|nr:leucyl/phenylalanyl-tRNA--protein transferase [Syntrophales bacterium]
MPVFRLGPEPVFPPPDLSSEEGLLAVGGDLTPERLLCAYAQGIFPWYSEGEPILWWSPDPRCVLLPPDLQVHRSMRQFLKKKPFEIVCDRAFRSVMESCGERRPASSGTWITSEMIEAYCRLHELGYAHSVETWTDRGLVGGLYGVSLGGCFFGESMFSKVSNASKAALITLTAALGRRGFSLIDCQMPSRHLEMLGAKMIPRRDFLLLLTRALRDETRRGNWGTMRILDL